MSVDMVRAYFKGLGVEGSRVLEFDDSSATVALAAKALNCEEARIAKTLSFIVGDKPILVVSAGDVKVSNPKYRATFKAKAKMLTSEETEAFIGHPVGGVCPFGVKPGVDIYLDESLKRFETVFPACGSPNSAIEVTVEELERYANPVGWVDIGIIK
jgi:prolyl-tRNA editing enzyme YbaK/EbsC (Cys-tRNA(Pro) deacylase)